MAVLLGVWRNSDGTFANMQAVGLFGSYDEAWQYVVQVFETPRHGPRRGKRMFRTGSLLSSFDDYMIEDLSDVEDMR